MAAPRPRVLAVSPFSRLGGGELLLVEMLGALHGRDVPVRLVVLGDGPLVDVAKSRRVSTVVSPTLSFWHPMSVMRSVLSVRRAMREFRPTVLHAGNPKAFLVNHLAGRGQDASFSVQVLDPPPENDHYVGVSTHLRGLRFAITPSAYNAWVPRSGGHPMRLVVPGVDADGLRARAARGDAERVWSGNGLRGAGAPRLVSVGRLQRYKGPFEVIDVARSVLAEVDARFLLVGPVDPMEPNLANELRARIDQLGLGDRVALAGEILEDDLAAVVLDATLLVHPVVNETFGLAVLEALALGTPVVAYDAPGPALLLREGGGATVAAGDAAEMAAAVRAALQDDALLGRWAREAKPAAAHFDLARMAGEYLAAFEALVGTRG